uniref:D-aminoacyl-tRNA deacylase n=1 Tax=Panagrolaimus sp. PS1159 TaxID=55785 RepID=A0AC35GMU9_9BILA
MRAVIQRVTQASVKIGEEIASEIGKGLCVLVGITHEDTATDTEFIIRKILNLRLFDDPTNGKRWDKSVKDLGYDVLVVSQFTLYGLLKGNKIDYHRAMEPTKAKEFYEKFYHDLQKAYIPEKVKDGEFGAMMSVGIVNDGPVTITIDSKDKSN